jgi:predicted dehydrogenase
MSDKKLKIAIIGNGGIARNAHAPAYEKMDNVEIVGACDIIEERAKAMAERFGAKFYTTDYKEIFNIEGLDAVDICTPNYFHSVIAVDALEHGLNVFCEKPDAINVDEAEKMKAAAEKSGKVLMVMRNNRFMEVSSYVKSFVEEGKMGEVYTARCGWQRRRGVPGKGGWFTTKALSGGGPLIDLGVHMIDLTMWLMGNPTPVAVSGCTYNKFADNKVSDSSHARFGDKIENGGTFDVEDLAMGFIRFDNGCSMQIEFSWASNVEKEQRFFELRGTKAGASWSSADRLRIYGEEYGQTVDILPNLQEKMGGHEANLRHFADVLLGKAEPMFVPQQGLDMIKILQGFYESAEKGEEIKL